MSKLLKLFAVVSLIAVIIALNFPQPAIALDTKFREQVESFSEEIMSFYDKGMSMESSRSGATKNLATCGKSMRFYKPQASELRERVSTFTALFPESDLTATGQIGHSLEMAAADAEYCVTCMRESSFSEGSFGYCKSTKDFLQTAQKVLDENSDE